MKNSAEDKHDEQRNMMNVQRSEAAALGKMEQSNYEYSCLLFVAFDIIHPYWLENKCFCISFL